MSFMRMSQAADYLGIGTITLRQYCDRGEIPYERTPKGQRVFRKEELDAYLDKDTTITPTNTAYYLRTSDGNKNTLSNQQKELETAYGSADNIYKDGASGLNEKRKGLQRLIRDAEAGKIKQVYATYPDRISRFGVSYIEHILEKAGCKVSYLHERNQTPQEELLDDFMKLVASFSGKFYQMRSYENQKKLLDAAHNEVKARQKKGSTGK